MAKKRGRKRFTRYLRGNIDQSFDLTTLAAADVVRSINNDTVNERTWLSSVVIGWSMKDLTITPDAGPIMVGVAHSDYTDAEVEAWIEETIGSWDEGALADQEVARRKIRRVGIFEAAGQALATQVLNDGKPIRTKCGWMLLQGQTVSYWAYNMGTAAIATTVPDVHVQGHANLWPR